MALPGGVFWLALYWSALLWGYGSTSERLILAGLWVVSAGVPMIIADQQRRVALELSPPSRAMTQVLERRLSGSLFNEIGVLRSASARSTAALQFVGDLHRILGQWEFARSVYNRVLETEPKNAAALIDLGAFYFRKSEFAKAVDFYKRAAEADPEDPTPFFNLSVAYSESYHSDESRRALSRPRAWTIAKSEAGSRVAPPERVVTVTVDCAAAEIRTEFAAPRREHEEHLAPGTASRHCSRSPSPRFSRRLRARSARCGRGYSHPGFDLMLRDDWAARGLRAHSPGLAASDGTGMTAFSLVLLPCACLSPPSRRSGWQGPWARSGSSGCLAGLHRRIDPVLRLASAGRMAAGRQSEA